MESTCAASLNLADAAHYSAAPSTPSCLLTMLQDSVAGIPIFVFLSPGVDVAASVEALGRKLGVTADNGRYAVVSLGQGQEPIAMAQLTQARAAGGWVLLQNIHLTIDWTAGPLEKAVDKLAIGSHPDFRHVHTLHAAAWALRFKF